MVGCLPATDTQWKRVSVEPIESHGGSNAALVITPSITGQFYGTVRLLAQDDARKRPCRLFWGRYESDPHKIRAGDAATLIIASVDPDTDKPRLVMHGNGGEIAHDDLGSWANHRTTRAWIPFEVALRAKEVNNIWTFRYRFRLTKDVVFEMESLPASRREYGA